MQYNFVSCETIVSLIPDIKFIDFAFKNFVWHWQNGMKIKSIYISCFESWYETGANYNNMKFDNLFVAKSVKYDCSYD